MVAAYGAMKPTELGLEEPQEQLHRIRITLSSRLQERHESRERCIMSITSLGSGSLLLISLFRIGCPVCADL